MDPYLFIGLLACAVIVLSIELTGSAIRNRDLLRLANKALDNQKTTDRRMMEVSKIHQELLSRPVNYVIPNESIQQLGNIIVQYLDRISREPR